MNKYENGIIYKIDSNGEIYIGSTIFTKEQRLKEHIKDYKSWLDGKTNYTSSFELFGKYGIENCSIDIIELFPCNSKKELELREGYWQRKEICINIRIAGRTYKDWYQDNKKELQEKNKQYYEKNKEQINTKELREHNKQYYEKNKEQINEKAKQSINCECGSKYTLSNKYHHFKTLKHLSFVKNI